MDQESRWVTVVYSLKSGTNNGTARKKQMAGLKWAKSQDGLLWLKSAVKTIPSNWAKSSQLGPGSSWAWTNVTRSQIGPRSQYGWEQSNQH